MRASVIRATLALFACGAVAADTDAAWAAPAGPAEIPVLAHAVARGEIVSAMDFESRPAVAAQANGILSPAAAAGREALRNLAAGMPVRSSDLVSPRLVRRGEPVVIAWRSGGMAITTGGRALSSGGAGEFVRVVAASTNRTLDAVVEGSGAVAVQ